MILIIDNYDSFTHNLYQQIESLGYKTKVCSHDKITVQEIKDLQPKKIIISPGPKNPDESGISIKTIEHFHKTTPILGVCLGHQCIGQFFGSKVVEAKSILHGKTSQVHHNNKGIFKNLQNPLTAARYHSLAISKTPEGFKKTAWTEDGEIMAIQHEQHPLYGIQFHPESFLTPEGDKLMSNFLK